MENKKIRLDKNGVRAVLREYLSRIVMVLFLLLASGDINWSRAWLIFWFMIGLNIIFHLAVVLPYSDIYNERGIIKPNAQSWDKNLLAVYALSGYLAMVIMGLDHRWGWTSLGDAWVVPGAALIAASFALSAWAMRANRFFSTVVRIQDDRGQKVCDRGPYAVIRHPGYFSAFLFYLGMPMALGTPSGFVFLPIVIGLFSYRIIREEKTLAEELDGYEAYINKVRYRLLPGIW